MEMEFAHLVNACVTVISQVQIAQLLNLLITWNVVICVHLIKESVNLKTLSVLTDISHVVVILDTLVLNVEFLFVLETVTTMENALLPILVLASEVKWVPSVRLIVDVQDTEHAILMVHANVMRGSSLISLLKSANSHVLINQVPIVSLQIHWVAVQDV